MKLFRPRRHDGHRHVPKRRVGRPLGSRCPRFEPLEQRHLLSVAPGLQPIPDVTVLAGAPLHVVLDGWDGDGDPLTYTASIAGSDDLTASIPDGNRSLRMSVQDHGQMIFELFENRAPKTAGRIIELAEQGFYDGVTFHRVIEDFMIQGGDPLGNGTGGSGMAFDDEFHLELQHTSPGILAMANSGPDTNDSQFFITARPTRWLDFLHPIFGFLTEGDEVRQSIAAVETDPLNDRPLSDVVITSMEVFTDTENGVLMLAAPEGASAEADVTVTVDDGKHGTAQQTFHVVIEPDPEDTKPFMPPMEDVTVEAGVPLTITLDGMDAEGDVSYTARVSGNSDLSSSITGNQLRLSAPAGSPSGQAEVTVTVSDSQGATHEESFRATLEGENRAPSLVGLPEEVTLQAGAPLHLALDGLDPDGDELTYTVTVTHESLTLGSLATYVPQGNRSLRMSIAPFSGFAGGEMLFELFEDRAPNTTARIIELAQTPRPGQPLGTGFYDGLIFHRVTEEFIQGGATFDTQSGGSGVTFDDEFHPELQHTSSGVLSMANSGDDTNDSQFFVTGGPTRSLDFNHTIFGFLTEGDDVRQAISSVATDENDQPLSDVVINSVEVFTDLQNGVLMLAAEEGASGEADVTVTVTDSHGDSGTPATFHVTVQSDYSNSNPFLLPIDDIRTTVNTPVQFAIPALDVEGDAIYYSAIAHPLSSDFRLQVSNDDGMVTLTPRSGATGIYGILLGVRATQRTVWDTQVVPVLIGPAAPTSVELLSDTGVSDSDRLTNLNNSPGNPLRFRVRGVIDGTRVTVLADGQPIGRATAAGGSAVVVSDGALTLADGVHAITAVQALPDQQLDAGNRHETVDLSSNPSPAFSIHVDATGPQFTSVPITEVTAGGAYVYDVQTDQEAAGQIAYHLVTAPAGMTIEGSTGRITWAPPAGQTAAVPVVVQADDPAGNQSRQSFEVNVTEPPVIDFYEALHQGDVDGYRHTFLTARSGRLTVEVLFSHAAGDVDLLLLDAQGRQIASSATKTDNERIDVTAAAGERYSLELGGANPSIILHVANLVVEEGNRLVVHGTAGDDRFEVAAGDPHRVVVNGVAYDVDPAVVQEIVVQGGGGDDRATLSGTAAADEASLEPRQAALTGSGYRVEAADVARIGVVGGGGNDTATVIDSLGDDTFVGTPVYAGLVGEGFSLEARSFPSVVAYAAGADGAGRASGRQAEFNVAKLYDSPGDDLFYAEPASGELLGNGFSNRVEGFDQVHAYATAGGHDVAELLDSSGGDRFYGSAIEAALFGDGFYNRAKHFEQVHAQATAGADRADLTDSPQDDTFVGKAGYGSFRGIGFDNRVDGFAHVTARATAGRDVAMLYDSPADDTFVATPTYGGLSGEGFQTEARFFDAVHAYATAGGHDVAKLFDSVAGDTFHATPEQAALFSEAYYSRAKFFEAVHAYATADGHDTARLTGGAADDMFCAMPDQSAVYQPGVYYNRAKHFEEVHGDGGHGGNDLAEMHGSGGDDVLEATPVYAALYGEGFYTRAENFPKVTARAGIGADDRAYLYDSALDDLLAAEDDWARLTHTDLGSLVEAIGFDYVKASSSAGDDGKQIAASLDLVLQLEGPWQDL